VAEPDHAECAAGELEALPAVPGLRLHPAVRPGQVPGRHEEQSDCELGDPTRVGTHRGSHLDPGGRGRDEVHVVDAYPVAGDYAQPRARRDELPADPLHPGEVADAPGYGGEEVLAGWCSARSREDEFQTGLDEPVERGVPARQGAGCHSNAAGERRRHQPAQRGLSMNSGAPSDPLTQSLRKPFCSMVP
jgi:hypothetical protein